MDEDTNIRVRDLDRRRLKSVADMTHRTMWGALASVLEEWAAAKGLRFDDDDLVTTRETDNG